MSLTDLTSLETIIETAFDNRAEVNFETGGEIRHAVNEALDQEMTRDPTVIMMGEDIVGGAGALLFKVLALRVLIEIGVAVTTLLTRQKNGSPES